jgi:hypothetical protein
LQLDQHVILVGDAAAGGDEHLAEHGRGNVVARCTSDHDVGRIDDAVVGIAAAEESEVRMSP